jgi:NADH-quinone oxidoreductase subunit E
MADSMASILEEAGGKRSELITTLQRIQALEGYLSPESLTKASVACGLSANEAFGVATFYSQFRFRPTGKHLVKVCLGTACHVRGASRIFEDLERDLKVPGGGTTEDRLFTLEHVACFGSCALAPVVVVDDKVHGRMTPAKTRDILKVYQPAGVS